MSRGQPNGFPRSLSLPEQVEGQLIKYCIEVDARYGLKRNYVKRIAFQLAIRNGI
jgi:hypothetical protein